MRKPYYKKSHRCWYVRWQGKDVRLDPTEEKAFDMWHDLRDSATPITPTVSFRRLAEQWLAETAKPTLRHKYDTAHVVSFVKHVKLMRASQLNKQVLTSWLNAKKPRGYWTQNTKHDAASCISRVLVWAVNKGYLLRNPLAGCSVPEGEPRNVTITPEDHARLFQAADPSMRQVLVACRCGARPRQIREVTAANVRGNCLVFTKHKTDYKTKKPLVVYMTPCLQTLVRHLATKHPTGPLFRTSSGEAWTADAMSKKFRRLRDKVGIPSVVIYSYRHTFATESLLAGNSLSVVAELMGHKDTKMVTRVYSHLDHHQNHLLEAAARTYLRR